MILKNLTKHNVVLLDQYGNYLEVFPNIGLARCSEVQSLSQVIDIGGGKTVNIYNKSFGKVAGLPEPQQNTLYIVSSIVAQMTPGRQDLVIPNNFVRNPTGQIIGCTSFSWG